MRNADFSLTGEKSVYFSGDKGILMDLNRNHEIIKLVTGSLVKSHKQAAANVGDGQLGLDIYVDGRYTHSEVRPVLNFLIITRSSRPRFLITPLLGRAACVVVEAGAAPSPAYSTYQSGTSLPPTNYHYLQEITITPFASMASIKPPIISLGAHLAPV